MLTKYETFWGENLMKALILSAVLLISTAPSFGQEISVISQANLASVLEQTIPVFEKQTGYKVHVALGNPGVTLQRLRDKEPADVVIVTTTILDKVVADGFLRKEAAFPIARGRIGVGVGHNLPKPVLPDAASFANFMLKAKSVAMVDPKGGSGTSPPVLAALDRMGILKEIEAKTKFLKGA